MINMINNINYRNYSFIEFWSQIDDIIQLTTSTADVGLPDIVVDNIPDDVTIIRVNGMLNFRMLINSGLATNQINGATTVNIKQSSGAWGVDDVILINISDNMFSTPVGIANGILIEGSNNVNSTVNTNTTYNLRFDGNVFVDENSLRLADVLVGLKIYFIAK